MAMDSPSTVDPFRHHPELRGKIADPLASFFREGFDPRILDPLLVDTPYRRYSEQEREDERRAFLASNLASGAELWVFAYGSLMWDPGFRFAEVRVGHALGYRRSFCLEDDIGGRGTPEVPGLMAALVEGADERCAGLVFRIAAELVDEESYFVWRRERVMPAYLPRMIDLETARGRIEALAFVADPDVPNINRALSREQQVRRLASGAGFLGSSRDYLENLAAGLEQLGLDDPALFALRDAVRAFCAEG